MPIDSVTLSNERGPGERALTCSVRMRARLRLLRGTRQIWDSERTTARLDACCDLGGTVEQPLGTHYVLHGVYRGDERAERSGW